MFADIVGYTALMQKDEASARELLIKFQSTLEKKVNEFNGIVIHFYGDGCLCVFDSAVDAVRCAKEVQEAFRVKPSVPVRIGLHSGDVVYEKDNAYGDSINITSRIESFGVAGAILFSEPIRSQISNQKEFNFRSLGSFQFKNVEEEMPIFALSNSGLVIPSKEDMKGKGRPVSPPDILPSEVRNKNIAVMIFDDETNEESLKAVGKMISDWITLGLMEIHNGKVISAANIRDNIAYASESSRAQQNYADRTGAEILIQGRYYSLEDQVFIRADIVNARSGSVIKSMETISGSKGEIMNLIDELSQRVLGYWATSRSYRYSIRPPKFKAYQAYLVAQDNWRVNDALVEEKLNEAFALDSTFYAPLLALGRLLITNFRIGEIKPLISKIESLDPEFTPYEKLRFEFLKALSEGNLELTIKKIDELAEINTSFLDLAGWINLAYNRPQRALGYYKRMNAIPHDTDTWDGQYGEFRQGYCLFQLGRHRELENYFDSLDFIVVNDLLAGYRLKNLIVLNEWALFDSLLVDYRNIQFLVAPAITYACWYMWMHDMPQLSRYMEEFREANEKYAAFSKYPWAPHLWYNTFSENYEAMIACVEDQPIFYNVKVIGLVRMGKRKEAEQFMLTAESQYSSFLGPGNLEYVRAEFHAILGEKDLAMSYLKKAYESGHLNLWSYREQLGFKDLHGYPAFDE
ncbi:MAG: adenylate/guanylate cyclase domain-containing protein, partial [Saprospiraceae bacterium]|nr:adenylate/guanylate cyclase domain-containing protein [Saprospiraceae bacterium]